jgi:hypothetical protein
MGAFWNPSAKYGLETGETCAGMRYAVKGQEGSAG